MFEKQIKKKKKKKEQNVDGQKFKRERDSQGRV